MKLFTYLLACILIILLSECKESAKRFENSTLNTPDVKSAGKLKDNSNEDSYIRGLHDKYGIDNKDIWGIGIVSNNEGNKSEMLNFPEVEMKLYNFAGGTVTGRIFKEKDNEYYNLFYEINASKEKTKIDIKDLIEINYEGTCLKYYERKGNFIKCLINIHDGGLWLDINELKVCGYSAMDWRTFLFQADRCYHPVSSEPLLIYDSDENVTDTLKRAFNVVKLNNEIQNDFVKVDIYKEDECGGCSNVKTGTGWLKIIDECGHPKIFFYTRGC